MPKTATLPRIQSAHLSKLFLEHLVNEHKFSRAQLHSLLGKQDDSITVPVSLFTDRQLGSFEAIVKYLHEDKGLAFAMISTLTNRDQRTIWTVYHKASLKNPVPFTLGASEYDIPLKVVLDRTFSVLESIVHYLHSNVGLSLSAVSKLLNRDPRTIFTVKKRFEVKASR